jgi:molybdopterin converting factor small subunit
MINKRSSSGKSYTMKVEIKLYASLGRYMPDSKGGSVSQIMELEEAITIGRLLERLKVPAHVVKLIFLNGVHARSDQVLHDGDRLGVFPPVAGG